MRLTDTELHELFNQAFDNHQAIAVDWDFGAEDVAFNIKDLVPSLDIDGAKAVQINGDWIETVAIEGKEYRYDLDSETKPLDIVKDANMHLKNMNKVFVFFDSKDDQFCFILIDLEELPEYLEKGFIKP
jgi:hypothetical protein